jgi:acyl-coenzyme A synthetase/AMP-(fatty) acid ligase
MTAPSIPDTHITCHHLGPCLMQCAEAAVVPVDHPIKGSAIYAFVTLMEVS